MLKPYMPMRKLLPLLFLISAGMVLAVPYTYARTKMVAPVATDPPPIIITAPTPSASVPTPTPTPQLAPAPAPAPASSQPLPSITADYFPVLPFGAAPDAQPSYIPVVANFPLTADHSAITKIVLYVHDASRDARRAIDVLRTLAGPAEATTMIVAPQFLIESDIAALAKTNPQMTNMFSRWAYGGAGGTGWEDGGDSVPLGKGRGISSFTALDLLLLYLGEKSVFPNVQQITVVGMGAGGNFVQRYAAVGRVPDLLQKQNTQLRFVVANASSYLYLTPSRFRGGRNGFAPLEEANNKACPDYNAWPFGLEHLNPYTKGVGANAAKLNYNKRRVAYLLGGGVSTFAPEAACGTFLEGSDEHARMDIYQIYLKSIYGEEIALRHSFTNIAKAGYDMAAIFGSSCGLSVVFGDGVCIDQPSTGNTTALKIH